MKEIPFIPEKCANCPNLLAKIAQAEAMRAKFAYSVISLEYFDDSHLKTGADESIAEFTQAISQIETLLENCKRGVQYLDLGKSALRTGLRVLTNTSEPAQAETDNVLAACRSSVITRPLRRSLLGLDESS
jgi:hypothetical protein